MEFDLIQHHYYRGVAAKALDQVQPVVGVVLLLALAAVEHQQVEAAPGQEELVGGVHDLLAAKVPNVEPNRLAAGEGQRPLGDLDALGLRLGRVEAVMHQAVHQAGLAHLPEAHQNELGLVQGAAGFRECESSSPRWPKE